MLSEIGHEFTLVVQRKLPWDELMTSLVMGWMSGWEATGEPLFQAERPNCNLGGQESTAPRNLRSSAGWPWSGFLAETKLAVVWNYVELSMARSIVWSHGWVFPAQANSRRRSVQPWLNTHNRNEPPHIFYCRRWICKCNKNSAGQTLRWGLQAHSAGIWYKALPRV